MTPPEEAMVDRLVRWAEIQSGSNNPAGLAAMATALETDFRDGFPQAAITTSNGIVRIQLRPQAPRQILLSGHYDTVYPPKGDRLSPEGDRLSTRREGDRLYGQGVADMKAGIVVMLEALRLFEQDAAAATLGWQVMLTPDEETGSVGSAAALAQAAGNHELALVFEPARPNGNLVRARMGTGILRVACHGREAHAGRDPEKGRNAILALAEVLPGIDAHAKTIPGLLLNVGTIRGGTAVNIVPGFAEAEINFRVANAAAEPALRRYLSAIGASIGGREGYRLEVSGGLNRPPKEITAAEEKAFELWRRCAEPFGAPPGWQDVGGGSDGNLLAAAGLPCLDGLGPIGDGLHSPDEYVFLPSLLGRAHTAASFLRALAAGAGPFSSDPP